MIPLNVLVPPSQSQIGWVFVETNEENVRQTLREMRERPGIGNTAMGVSAFFTLNAASLRSSIEHIVIFDVSASVQRFWQDVERVVLSEDDRMKTIQKIKLLLKENRGIYFRDFPNPEKKFVDSICGFEAMIELDKSWLSSDDRYRKIREIFSRRNFCFLLLDLKDSEKFEVLGRGLADRKMTVDFIYLGNIAQHIFQFNKPKWIKDCISSVKSLIQGKALVIDAAAVTCRICPSFQRVQEIEGSQVKKLFESRFYAHDKCKAHRVLAPDTKEFYDLVLKKIKDFVKE